ncbi:MAG: DUF1573 domain-containing protein [Prevotellaceae bacterium]|jgi:hypothetical protein|nr:DUF1573 domain-containing protein [Prevotellaceae bacterium]
MKKLFSVSIFVMLFAMLAQANEPAKKSKKAPKQVETTVAAATPITVQGPGIEFVERTHDFGKIQKPSTAIFEFTNNGTEPLILSNVKPGCGCTTPDWTKEPVAPGAKGFVKATFNAASPGQFNKSVTVTTNAAGENATITLTIKGEVVPQQDAPAQ